MPEPPSLDTFDLLELHRAGDSWALEELLRRHYPRVQRVVRVRLGPALAARVEVGDVVQQTMARAVERLDEFTPRDDARLIHWLARIAENEILRLAKYHGAERRNPGREHQAMPPGQSGSWQPPSPSTQVPERAARREREQIVDACLAGLAEDQREVVLLREYVGGDWAFVATEMRRSSEAAQQLYQRARRALADRVRRRIAAEDV